eukprot:m.299320 g.299320  ORF g.299320 m.299320 type:complete len:59 (-) comp55184_c0_seq3:99-275(-)
MKRENLRFRLRIQPSQPQDCSPRVVRSWCFVPGSALSDPQAEFHGGYSPLARLSLILW